MAATSVIRVLSEDDTARAFPTVAETVALVEASLMATAGGTTLVPPKAGLKPNSGKGFFHWMPFIDRDAQAVGLKWVSYIPGNADRDLIDSNALVMLCDADSGYPTGILGGMGITALRTAAGALVGARHFAARPPERLALVGCGRIQRETARFFMEFYPDLKEVTVYARTPANREAFCAEFEARYARRFRACDRPRAALDGADMIVSCVPQAAGPLLSACMFKPGAIYVPLDVTASWDRSVYDSSDLVVSDNLAQFESSVRERRGNLDLDLGRVVSMGDVLRNSVPVPEAPQLVTSVVTGTAETDLFVARFILDKATQQGIGIEIPFG